MYGAIRKLLWDERGRGSFLDGGHGRYFVVWGSHLVWRDERTGGGGKVSEPIQGASVTAISQWRVESGAQALPPLHLPRVSRHVHPHRGSLRSVPRRSRDVRVPPRADGNATPIGSATEVVRGGDAPHPTVVVTIASPRKVNQVLEQPPKTTDPAWDVCSRAAGAGTAPTLCSASATHASTCEVLGVQRGRPPRVAMEVSKGFPRVSSVWICDALMTDGPAPSARLGT